MTRIKNIISTYSDNLLSARLDNLELDKEMIIPVIINEVDLASQREKLGKTIGGFLPYIFILFCNIINNIHIN